MNKQILFATGNEHKMVEIRAILADLGMPVVSLKEMGIDVEIDENGSTFEENAMIKALEISRLVENTIVLADDSGLEIDYLNKEPGIYSARYAGVDTSYTIKNQMLIDRLDGVADQERTARFVCAIGAVFPDGSCEVVRGTVEGFIGYESKGENGFGYDPIFFLPKYNKTLGEISSEEKNKLSHRGNALEQIKPFIKKQR